MISPTVCVITPEQDFLFTFSLVHQSKRFKAWSNCFIIRKAKKKETLLRLIEKDKTVLTAKQYVLASLEEVLSVKDGFVILTSDKLQLTDDTDQIVLDFVFSSYSCVKEELQPIHVSLKLVTFFSLKENELKMLNVPSTLNFKQKTSGKSVGNLQQAVSVYEDRVGFSKESKKLIWYYDFETFAGESSSFPFSVAWSKNTELLPTYDFSKSDWNKVSDWCKKQSESEEVPFSYQILRKKNSFSFCCFSEGHFQKIFLESLLLIVDITSEGLGEIELKEFFFIAHNGARFDLVLFLRSLLEEAIFSTNRLWNFEKFAYLDNKNKIVRFDIGLITPRCGLHFRDSLLFLTTAEKSLRGAAKELQIAELKSDFYFCFSDALFMTYSQQMCWKKSLKKAFKNWHHKDLIGPCQNKDCCIKTCKKNNDFLPVWGEVAEVTEDQALEDLFKYNVQDTVCLRSIMTFILRDILEPHFDFNNTVCDVLFIGSLATATYQQMMRNIVSHCQPEKLMIPQGSLDSFCRKSLFGGRCVSSCIGQTQTTSAMKFWAEQTARYSQNNSDTSQFTIWVENEFANAWIDKLDSIFYGEDSVTWAMIMENVECLTSMRDELPGFFEALVLTDVCSEYPSALCSPLPIGKFSESDVASLQEICDRVYDTIQSFDIKSKTLLSEKDLQKQILHIWKKPNKNFFESNAPAFVRVSATLDRAFYEKCASDCSYHSHILFGHVPIHTSDYPPSNKRFLFLPQKKFGFDETKLCGSTFPNTIWAVGKNIDLTFTLIDLFELTRKAPWKIEVKQVVLLKTWSDKASENFFVKSFSVKREGEEEGNIGKRAIGKVMMNSSYGGAGLNVAEKFRYSLTANEEFDRTQKWQNDPSLSSIEKEVCTTELLNSDGMKSLSFTSDAGTCAVFSREKIGNDGNFTRYLPLASFCLSYSRMIFDQLLYEPAWRKCPTEFLSQVFYADTDSVVVSVGNALFRKPSRVNRGTLGYLNREKMNFHFSETFESTGKNKFCPWWNKTKYSQMPCFCQLRVFGKKAYGLFCLLCGGKKLRFKGQNLSDEVLSSLDVFSASLSVDETRSRSIDLQKRRLKYLKRKCPKYTDELSCVPVKKTLLATAPVKFCTMSSSGCQSVSEHLSHCENCKNEDSKLMKTARPQFVVSLFSSTQKNYEDCWKVNTEASLTRSLNIVPDVHMFTCSTCLLSLPIYLEHEKNDTK